MKPYKSQIKETLQECVNFCNEEVKCAHFNWKVVLNNILIFFTIQFNKGRAKQEQKGVLLTGNGLENQIQF